MVKLFRSLFEPYGHVYQHPRYKKDTGTYEWNVQVILDESFAFLFQKFSDVKDWIQASERRTIAYLSGFLDAEGSILVTRNSRGGIVTFVDYFNENKGLLEWIKAIALRMGQGCSLRINKPIGRGTTGFHLNHNSEYWQLSIFGAQSIMGFIESLMPRHPEKIERKNLALAIDGKTRYEDMSEGIIAFRNRTKNEVAEFVKLAESQYLESHPRPSKID